MIRISFTELLSIAHRSLFLISKNIYILYLGIISIIFSTVLSIFQFINPPSVTIPHKFITKGLSSGSIILVKWIFYLLNFIKHLSSGGLIIFIIAIVVYIIISIYFTVAASSTIIKTLADNKNWEHKGNFREYWKNGIKSWVNYFIYSLLFGIIFTIVFFVFLLIAVSLVNINSLFLIVALIIGIILLVFLFTIAYIGLRLVLIENMDIIDAFRFSFSLVKNNFSLFINITLFYIITLLVLYLFSSIIESIITSVVKSLSVFVNISFIYPLSLIGIIIMVFILGVLAVYSSAFWTGVFLFLRDEKKLFKISHT